MKTNLERYKQYLERLIKYGQQLLSAMQVEFMTDEFRKHLKKLLKDENKISCVVPLIFLLHYHFVQ